MAALRPVCKDGVMADRMEAPPRPSRAPVPRGQIPGGRPPGAPRRSRKRWAVAAAVTALWVVLWTVTGSLVSGTIVLLFLAALGVVTVLALRALGVTRDHPWIQQISTRPWRDGQEVLQLALRHLPEVFVVTPNGALLAPNAVELRLNPRDVGSLGERMDIGLVEASAAEVYEEQVAVHQARLAGPGPVEVSVVSDPAVPAGRYQLRQGRPLGAAPSSFQPASPSGFQPASQSGFQPAVPAASRLRRGRPDVQAARPEPVGSSRPARVWVAPPQPGRSPMTAAPPPHRCPPPTPPSAVAASPPLPSRPEHNPDAAADHRRPGRGDPAVRGPGGPRRGRNQPSRRAHRVPRARQVHLLRRPVVGRQPGHERAHAERRLGRRGAAAARRRRDPLGHDEQAPGSRVEIG